SNPEIGEGLLTTEDIFGFEIGDEMHYYESLHYTTEEFTRRKVLEKELIGDTLNYSIEKWLIRNSEWYDYESSTWEEFIYEERDTISETYKLNGYQGFNIHPYEVDSSNINPMRYYGIIEYSDNFGWIKTLIQGINNSSTTISRSYANGLGYTHHFFRESPYILRDEDLIYYNKNGEIWGTPIDFELLSSNKEIKDPQNTINLYPNPATHNITLTSENKNTKLHHILVINSLGQTVADWPWPNKNELTKSVANFPKGMYWLIITDDKGELWRKNFIKN
ncbi:MAG: T9SS type A sorting domain-containing protein, partial [Saprospiraceae bacterium]